jgi:integrase
LYISAGAADGRVSVAGNIEGPAGGDDGCSECLRLRTSLTDAWAESKELRRTVAAQGRLLALLAPETSPTAPSLNCLYWLYSLVRGHERSWAHIWWRLQPLLRRLGQLPAPELNPVRWEQHRSVRRTEPDRRGNLPNEYLLNIELTRAKEMINWGVSTGILLFNPLAPAKNVKAVCERETRLRQADIETLLASVADLRDERRDDYEDDGARAARIRAFVLCCFDSMLRFNEARHLRRDLIRSDGSYTLSWTTTKNQKARTVVLTPRTLAAIDEVAPVDGTHFVFANPDTGALFGETLFRRLFRKACAAAGLDARCAPGDKRIVVHHLRHAGASEADEAGARPGAIKDLLGHARLATTEKYLHREKTESARHVAERMVAAATKMRRPPQRAAHKVRKEKSRNLNIRG